MVKGAITLKDGKIFELLQDENYRVFPDGRIETKVNPGGKSVGQEWRPCGSLNHTRYCTKKYWKVSYKGTLLYAHRIIWAAFKGYLNKSLTVNHKDLNGLNNNIDNLELITAGNNLKHAHIIKKNIKAFRRMGMSAAEAKAAWKRGK